MNDDNDLFGTPVYMLHRTNDPDTSVEAAELVDTSKGERRNYDICLAAEPLGVTSTVGALKCGIFPNAFNPRWSALVRKGLVRDSGERRPSPKTGRMEIVWRIERRAMVRPEREPREPFDLEQ